MARLRSIHVLFLFVIVDMVPAKLDNMTQDANKIQADEVEKMNHLGVGARRSNKVRETSSSSGESGRKTSGESGQSIGVSDDSSEDTLVTPGRMVKSSLERKGWRKWHRKCTPCREEMAKKWRDPSIRWICGAYQRARRSFKSLCMMHFRNCQDGTMFTKIHDHRCKNSTNDTMHGQHFFYDYFAKLSDETSKSDDADQSTQEQKLQGASSN